MTDNGTLPLFLIVPYLRLSSAGKRALWRLQSTQCIWLFLRQYESNPRYCVKTQASRRLIPVKAAAPCLRFRKTAACCFLRLQVLPQAEDKQRAVSSESGRVPLPAENRCLRVQWDFLSQEQKKDRAEGGCLPQLSPVFLPSPQARRTALLPERG